MVGGGSGEEINPYANTSSEILYARLPYRLWENLTRISNEKLPPAPRCATFSFSCFSTRAPLPPTTPPIPFPAFFPLPLFLPFFLPSSFLLLFFFTHTVSPSVISVTATVDGNQFFYLQVFFFPW